MDPAAWLRKALDELVELGPVAEDDPADAWRAATLIARLLGSPSGPISPAALVRRLPQLLTVAGLPDPQALLDRLADELDAETDPAGPLFDTLLDIDDTLGVLATSGQSTTALELARRSAALVSLYPERVHVLGSFADMRLQTVRDGTATGLLWGTVERAPAHAVVEALPAPASSGSRVDRLPETRAAPVHAQALSFYIPEEMHRPAAESETAEARELETVGAGLQAWVYAEQGRMRLEVRGAGAGPLTAVLIAERVKDGAEVSRVAIDVEISGSTLYADLGPWAGPENALHRLVAGTGLVSSNVRVRLAVSNG